MDVESSHTFARDRWASDPPFGAVIAGGRSVRYGEPKALVRIGGVRLIDRVVNALRQVTPDVVLITNDAQLGAHAGLDWRPDVLPDLGALGGIHAALRWAAEAGRPGILAVACDMPFLSPPLLARILELANASDAPDIVLPASDGPRGIEPLCAYYTVACLAAIERALDAGDRRMISFHREVVVHHIARDEVAGIAPSEQVFFNVNTRNDRERAERILFERSRAPDAR